jgi:hypothetical protein
MKKHLQFVSAIFCATLSLSAQIPTNGLVSKWAFESRISSEFTKDEHGTAPPLTLGSVTGFPNGNSLNGSLNGFLFYNRALTAQEVNDIFKTTTTVGLKSYRKINNSQITIYPNPTSSILNIEVKKQNQIFITNLLGEDLKKENIYGSSQIDVSEFSAIVNFIKDASSCANTIKFIKA